MTRSIVPATRCTVFMASLVLSGCVGFSRQEPGELFPADSLSREIAEATAHDTLQILRHIDHLVVDDSSWQYIASLQFRTDGRLVAADLGRALAYVISPEGTHLHTIRLPGAGFPYLLHAQGDTLVVHDAGAGQVVWFANDQAFHRIAIPASTSREALTVFAGLARSGLFVKKTADPGPATLFRYDTRDGHLLSTTALEGPTWKFRGPFLPWGDSLLSVSAYLPQLHLIKPDASIDSLRLVGFDSPALNRTRLFVIGKRKDPPLLVPAVASAHNLLFVLNVRPDQLRIDVYDHTGRLIRILEDGSVEEDGLNVVDLAAFERPDGTVTLAVAAVSAQYRLLSLRYQPRISLYHWKGAP